MEKKRNNKKNVKKNTHTVSIFSIKQMFVNKSLTQNNT